MRAWLYLSQLRFQDPYLEVMHLFYEVRHRRPVFITSNGKYNYTPTQYAFLIHCCETNNADIHNL